MEKRIILTYRKLPKYSDTQTICCNHSKIWTMWLYHRVMSPNDADGMANSVDPDQTAPLGAVWSGSALFAQTCLSENLGKLRYILEISVVKETFSGISKMTSCCHSLSRCLRKCRISIVDSHDQLALLIKWSNIIKSQCSVDIAKIA